MFTLSTKAMKPKRLHPEVEAQRDRIAAGLEDDDRYDDGPRRMEWDDMVAEIESDMD